MSDADDMQTPIPRRPSQDVAFFVEDRTAAGDFGVVSIAPESSAGGGERSQMIDSLNAIMAQQELIARALSPERTTRTSVSNDLPFKSSNIVTSPGRSDVVSSRPGTPLSQPSMPPVPSNPSTFPEDQQIQIPGPSLVMPEVQMAPRRLYSKQGKRVGKLRLMFVGDSGSGKTTLLRAFAQCCKDVVYHENMVGSEPGRSTTEINEVRASTQPYPSWKLLGPKQSAGDLVMERNLCLVDSPGYGLSAEPNDAIDPIMRYTEAQFVRTNDVLRDSARLNDADFVNLIAASSGGLTHVDAAIYCISKPLTDIDLHFMERITQYTKLVPVITIADRLEEVALGQLRAEVSSILAQRDLDHELPILAISCKDPEVECSIMMHDDYEPNLINSDLPILFTNLLHNDNPARLRHHTAKQYMKWRAQLQRSLVTITPSAVLLPSAEFTVSRIAEHTRHQDSKARLRIAAWASEMRTTMAINEHDEKSAEWLVQRMNDYVDSDTKERRKRYIDESDPFGLIRLRERWTRRARRICQWCIDLGLAAGISFACWRFWQVISQY